MNVDKRPIAIVLEKHLSKQLVQIPIYRAMWTVVIQLELFITFTFTQKYQISGGIVSSLFGSILLFTIIINHVQRCFLPSNQVKQSKINQFDIAAIVLFVISIILYIIDFGIYASEDDKETTNEESEED